MHRSKQHLYSIISSECDPISGLGAVGLDENFQQRTNQFRGTSGSGMLIPISR
jgi:hypothetical protein